MNERKSDRGAAGINSIFLMVGGVLVLSVACAYLMGQAVIRHGASVVRQQGIIDYLNDTLSTLKDAETGQRGYLLTGDDAYLQPYVSARSRIFEELNGLDQLVFEGGLEKADVDRFKERANAKLGELEKTVNLRREKGSDAATAVLRQGIGRREMDDIRQLTARIVNAETVSLHERQASAARLGGMRTLVFALVTLMDMGFLYWANRRIHAERRTREMAAAEVLRQKELLGVTLASIGDGVIVTDAKGLVTFMNQMALTLTGWNAAEAIGQPSNRVFNIVNEESRQTVQSPVDKVIEKGVIVGLANHTILLQKDGGEIPIDDSGAPIRDIDGTLRGVVLVFRNFAEHKKAEAELRAAKEEAEAANVAKDNFLATLSHELRTPLTPVSATLATWEFNRDVPEAFLADVQMMRRNVDLEARLIDDLLDLTRIVRGKLVLNPEVADLHELIGMVAAMYRSEVHSKQLKFSLDLQAGQHHIYADPGRIQQVFWNILKNATKFTPEGGTIAVGTTNEDGRVSVTIHDSGIGMTPEILSKLFQPFEQGTDEVVRRYGGLGLGMAISKALLEAQGGTILASSEGPGRGSTVAVRLPAISAPLKTAAPAPAKPPLSVSRSLNILLVEDHVDTARAMARLLRGWGHRVSVADCVRSAVDSASETAFDLLLSDIGLPDGTGIDLIRAVRQKSDMPAVALTGYGMEEDVAKCKAAGFNDHLTKPVNFQKLEVVIQQLAAMK